MLHTSLADPLQHCAHALKRAYALESLLEAVLDVEAGLDSAFELLASLEPESLEPESLEPESLEPDSFEPESFEPDSLVPESFEPESDDVALLAPEFEERESVMYQPLPLKTMPTG